MYQMFISSVQKELAAERRALKAFIGGDALLGQYFRTFLFEDLPAGDQRPEQQYIGEVDRCAVYLGIFGNEYGWEDAAGVSPTEREFDRATEKAKTRLVFVKGQDDKARQPKMLALIRKAEKQLTRRRFEGITDLNAKVYASLVQFLQDNGDLRSKPLDALACDDATLQDVSPEKIRWFLERAKAERGYAVSPSANPKAALAHLNLLDGEQPTYGGILLFGRLPQKYLPTSEIKCMHFHATEVAKPIPSYQVYKGTAFDLVDQALDFVLAKLARQVSVRAGLAEAQRSYEVPDSVIREAIVNAVAHRDYTSKASVQVMVFADRVEVWNPGRLPEELTLEQLRVEHPSIPANPLMCDPLFLAHYVEKAGTGTLDMIRQCVAAGLPEPEFEQRGGEFVVTVWRDWLTDEILAQLDLSPRQSTAVNAMRRQRRITSGEYQRLTGASRATAKRDLEELVRAGLLMRAGAGRGAFYELARKRLANGSNGSNGSGGMAGGNGSQSAQMAHVVPSLKRARGGTKRMKGTSRAKRTGNTPIAPSRQNRKPKKKGRR